MEVFTQVVVGVLVVAGGLFSLVAAIGVVRLPDILVRMHASTKAGTLGAGLILLAVAVFFRAGDISARAGAGIAFLLLTAPVAAHMIARAAYFAGVPLWKKTGLDELREHYDRDMAARDAEAAADAPPPPPPDKNV
jgi:multicomponent Na+:H+ antiporter subunit G